MHSIKPVVSIVMPTFNSSEYVCKAVESVIAQTFKEWELLIVDDASSDGTVEMLQKRYTHEPRIQIDRLPRNGGAAIARNAAIHAACGRFIAFLDSDDLWKPDKLAIQVPLLTSSDAIFCFSSYDLIRGADLQVVQRVSVPTRLVHNDLLYHQPVGCLTAMYDTDKVGKVFMPDIRMRQDWGLWLRLLRNGGSAVGIQESLAVLRLHEGSLSANKLRASYFNYKLLRTEGGLPPLRAATSVLCHAWRAVKRRKGLQ